jgi:predicted nucleotidyltransferase
MLTKQQIDDILQELEADERVGAILLTGSYAYGVPTEDSDLDVRVVTKNGENWAEQYRMRFGHKVELFCNPPDIIRDYFETNRKEQKPHALHFWTHGTIVYDPTGIAAELQNEAKRLLELGPHEGTWEKSEKHNI